MSNEPTYPYRDSYTGKITRLTEDAASVFPDRLERVSEEAKPFEPGLFKPGKVGEFQNEEPLTDEQLQAEAELNATLEDHSPRSRAAREAKAAKEAADQEAADALAAAQAEQEASDKEAAEAAEQAASETTSNTEGQ